MSYSLTHKQAELLAFIESYQQANGGVSPSYEEMSDAIGISAKSGICRLVKGLADRGKIETIPNHARAIKIVRDDFLRDVSTAALIAELARRSGENRRAA